MTFITDVIAFMSEDISNHWMNIFYIILIIISTFAAFWFINVFYKKLEKTGKLKQFPIKRIWLQLAILSISMLLVLAGLPGISNTVIQIVGLVAGAIVAFSSSTLIANFMSGILIKIIEPYKVGNMIKIKDYLGKVYHIGILHTEIQTPKREIINIPNLVAISDPVVNYSEGDYIINIEVSLGYDISPKKIEEMLVKSIEKTGLKKPFVLINNLGNYAVTYEANGLLEDASRIITARSNLRKNILMEFNKNRVEILSPMYINKKSYPMDKKTVPKRESLIHKFSKTKNHSTTKPEKIMYEKADEIVQEKEQQVIEENISQAMKKMTGEEKNK